MGDGPILDAWCPHADAYLSLGDGPASGVALTSGGGDIFTYSDGKTNIDANATLWLQSNDAGGIVCSSGVVLGTPSGALTSAGGNVEMWAGAAYSPNVGGPNGAAGDPTAPSPPCADTVDNVNRVNAINGAVKGAADIYSGVSDIANADSALDKAKGAWDTAKGAWDVTKSANDAYGGDGFIPGDVAKGIDGAVGAVDTLITAGGGEVFNPVGAFLAGKKLGEAGAGLLGDEASGGGAGGGGGGHGGGGEIIAKAPAGIKKITDADMEGYALGKIEYKAGTNIGMNAGSKVETCSMVFEAHANVSATMKGLARAKVESLGSSTLSGKAKFTVETSGSGKIEAGKLDVGVKGDWKSKVGGKWLTSVSAAATITGETFNGVGKSEANIKAPTINLRGTTNLKKGDVTIDKNLEVKGKIKGMKPVILMQKVTIKQVTKITANVFLG